MNSYIRKAQAVRTYHLGYENSDPDWFTRAVFDERITRSTGDSIFLLVKTPEGTLKAHPGDYVIYDNHNLYVCTAVNFVSQYEAEDAIPLGKYRHYKGNIYNVIGKGTHTETNEQMVIYKSCDGSDTVWVRPAGMWNELVVTATGTCKRFTKL